MKPEFPGQGPQNKNEKQQTKPQGTTPPLNNNTQGKNLGPHCPNDRQGTTISGQRPSTK